MYRLVNSHILTRIQYISCFIIFTCFLVTVDALMFAAFISKQELVIDIENILCEFM